MTLWSRNENVPSLVEEFCVGEDPKLDLKLALWDCYSSMAHAKMLGSIGIISKPELTSLHAALVDLTEIIKAGDFKIKREDEDCHTAIENYLTQKCGEAGKRIHTGRSRNDQVLTALKLYIKAELYQLSQGSLELAQSLVKFGEANAKVELPGYTHQRRAMPSSLPFWAGAFAESLSDDAKLFLGTAAQLDSSPLGSAAGYGVPIPLNREMTANDLGFARVHWNTLSAQHSRGKNEALTLSACSQVMLTLNRLASDLILYSTSEYGFLKLPKEFCTGSSIMPQKLNPDVLELMRAKSKVVFSLQSQVTTIVADLPSGYNRDLQITKGALIEGIEIARGSLKILSALIQGIKVDEVKCKEAMDPTLYAAHYATTLAAKGIPFRDAYHQTKEKLESDPAELVKSASMPDKNSATIGSPANPGLGQLKIQLNETQAQATQLYSIFIKKLEQLASGNFN